MGDPRSDGSRWPTILLIVGAGIVSAFSAVAFLLGFSDQSHFSRLFKRVVGFPPGDYRRRVLPLG
jgi:hypothetical protein